MNMSKMVLILYVDDIVIFGSNSRELQQTLDLLFEYCYKWKLIVNTANKKIMVFRSVGRLQENLAFCYNKNVIKNNKKKCVYLGIVFTSDDSFAEAQNTFSGLGLKT